MNEKETGVERARRESEEREIVQSKRERDRLREMREIE